MKTEDVIGFVVLAFLAGSLATMILFTLIDQHIEKTASKVKPDAQA